MFIPTKNSFLQFVLQLFQKIPIYERMRKKYHTLKLEVELLKWLTN